MNKFIVRKTHLLLGSILVVVLIINVTLLLLNRDKLDFKKVLVKTPKLNMVIITEPACRDCFDLTQVAQVVQSRGAKTKTTVLNRNNPQAKALIDQYKIAYLPAFVISGDTNDPSLKELWDNFGEIKNNVVLFARQIPPYYEIAAQKIHGEFEVTYLTDASCASCYDVTIHTTALKNLGLVSSKITTLEASTTAGKALIKKYKITSLPTILLIGDLKEYKAFDTVWPQVGTKETDGTYVFRDVGQKQMGTYKDLKTGKIIPQEVLNDTGAPVAK